MSELKVKTRENTDPKGKSRVYFCCNQHDFPLYFESLSDELLMLSDCAVYYCEDGDNSFFDAERQEDLKTVQLFVIPVTSRLLGSFNTPENMEINFAIGSRIPILPVIEEKGLTDAYRAKFGEVQFLDKTEDDETAIAYEEKLKDFLATFLIGDELKKRVEAAFSGSIFLSYRKKDRKFANELMKKIHDNPLLRDISIWYDEYLIPGRHFPEAIENALKNSDLFVMLVTPNLINEDNYVISTEYPAAKKYNIPVLAAEAVETDKEKLKSCCTESLKYNHVKEASADDAAAAADYYNGDEFYRRLEEMLSAVISAGKEDSPEHDYLIGMAYLKGIGVENDRERGIELIKSAAGRGNTEAIKALALMYKSGDALIRDYEKALACQKKLVQVLDDKLKESGSCDDAVILADETYNLGRLCITLGKTARAKEAYSRAVVLCSGEYKDADLGRLKERRLSYLNVYGDLLYHNGELCETESVLKESLSLVLSYDDSLWKEKKLVSILSDLGRLEVKRENYDEAEKYFLEALDKSIYIYEKEPSPMVVQSMFSVCLMMGDLEKAQHKYDEAMGLYEKAYDAYKGVYLSSDLSSGRYNLSLIYERRAGIHFNKKEYDKAAEEYKKKLEIQLELDAKQNSLQSRRSLSVDYLNIAKCYYCMDDRETAAAYYKKALNIRKSIYSMSDTVQAVNDIANAYYYSARLLRDEKDFIRAEEYYKESIKYFEEAAGKSEEVSVKRDLKNAAAAAGAMLSGEEKYPEALEYYIKACKYAEIVSAETQTDPDIRSFAGILSSEAEIYKKTGDEDRAYTLRKKEIEIRESIKKPGKGDFNSSYDACREAGILAEKLHDNEAALYYYKKQTAFAEALPGNESRIYSGCTYVGNILFHTGKTQEALPVFIKAAENALKYDEKENSDYSKESCYIGMENCAVIYGRLENYKAAAEYYIKALFYREKREKPDASACGHDCKRIGDYSEKAGDTETAVKYYEKALDFYTDKDSLMTAEGICCTLGNIYYGMKDYAKALIYFLRSSDIYDNELSENPGDKILRGSMLSYENSGITYGAMGENEKALAMYSKEEESFERIKEKTDKDLERQLRFIRLKREVYEKIPDKEAAFSWYIETLSKIENREDALTEIDMLSTAAACMIFSEKKDYKEALIYFLKSSEVCDIMLEKSPSAETDSSAEISFENTAICYGRLGDTEKSVYYRKKAFEIAKKDKDGGYDLCEYIGAGLYKLEKYAEAEKYYKYLSSYYEKNGKKENYKKAAVAFGNTAALLNAQGKSEEAAEYYIKEADIREKLLTDEASFEDKKEYSKKLKNLSDLLIKLNRASDAAHYLKKAAEADSSIKALIEDKNEVLAEYSRKEGDMYASSGDTEKAVSCYKKEIELLLSTVKLKSEKKHAADRIKNLAALLFSSGDYKAAESYYIKEAVMRRDVCSFSADAENLCAAGLSYKNAALCELRQDKYEDRETYLIKAYEYYEKAAALPLPADTREILGEILIMQGDICEYNKDYEAAREKYFAALDKYLSSGNKKAPEECIRKIADTVNKKHGLFTVSKTVNKITELYEKYSLSADENFIKGLFIH